MITKTGLFIFVARLFKYASKFLAVDGEKESKAKSLVAAQIILLGFLTAFSVNADDLTIKERFQFSIPQQQAVHSLKHVAEQANITLIFPFEALESKTANALDGKYTAEVALRKLLQGTGYEVAMRSNGHMSIVQTRESSGGVEDMYKFTKIASTVMSIAAATTISTSALAQQGNNQNSAITLEEITVTGAKTGARNLQDVPIAITALGEEQLDTAGVVDFFGIAYRTPGLAIGEFNVGQPQIFIRGIGSNDDGAGGDQSVGIFVDDVYIGRAAGSSLDIFDIERIEVLRGPQGTLYGKNVIGGALSITSSKPTAERTGKFELGFGNLGQARARGIISGPVAGDKVLGKISFNSFTRDGYVTDITDTLEFQDKDDKGVRAGLRFLPNDNLTIDVNADYAVKRQKGPGRQIVGPGLAAQQEAFAASIGAPRRPSDPYVTSADDEGFQDRDNYGISAQVNYETDNGGKFTSITAYREVEFSFVDDVFGARPGDTAVANLDVNNGAVEDSDQFSQEFRWNKKGEKLEYTIGAFFLRENVTRNEFIERIATDPRGLQRGDSFQENETDSIAVFGQLTYSVNDSLNITVGARQTSETKDNTQSSVAGVPIVLTGTFAEVSNSQDFDAFTPRFVLDYKVNDDLLTYFSYSRGFKSGGFQGTPPSVTAASTNFNEEFADSFEVGLKGEFFDNRLRLNAALFHTDYEDLQVLQFLDNGDIVVSNAATATLEGLELEVNWLVSESVEIFGTYAYLDATYDEFVEANGTDNAGNPLRNAPENSYNIGINYTHPLNNGGTIRANYEHRGQDTAFQNPGGVANIVGAVPKFDLGNARISYITPNENWKVDLWVENIWDEVYFTHNFPFGPTNGFATVGPPRTYGVTATYSF